MTRHLSRTSVLLALAIFLSVAADIPRAADAQSLDYVLVRREAFLYARADAASERVRDPWGTRYQQRLGPFWVMRFVAENSGWVQVATLPVFRAAEHCYPTVSGLEGLDLRFYVRRADVAPVTARQVRQTFEDGTSLTIVAGVGVVARGRNHYDAMVRGATVRLDLGAADLAARYRPIGKIPVSRSSNALLAPGARVDFGNGGRLTAEAGRRARGGGGGHVVSFSVADTRRSGGGGDDGPPRAPLAVEQPPTTQRGRSLAFVRNSCLELNGFVNSRDLTMDREGRPAVDLGSHHGTSLNPGTMLYWPDGSRAGRVADNAALDGAPREQGPRVCFDHPLRGAGSTSPRSRTPADDVLTLCVDRDVVASRGTARRAFGGMP